VHDDGPEFARLLKAAKRAAGLSDADVAEEAGVDRSQAWRWANAGGRPGYEPARRLAAWLIGARPDLAEIALALLPAAGYETPPGMAPPGAPPAAAPPSTAGRDIRTHLYAAIDAVNQPLREQVAAEIRDARARWTGPGGPPAAAFLADPVERAIWDHPDWDDDEKADEIAAYRARRAALGAGPTAASEAG
jgi:transcriptional regulator with XRE-family HTH domain